MTHWKKLVSDSSYMGEADFQENEEKVLTIARINASELVVTAEGKSQKAVVHWQEPGNKPMILNVARAKNIAKVAGTPDVDRWPGVALQLYIEHGIKAFNELVSAVRVRPYRPKGQERLPPCADCGGPVLPAYKMSAARLAAYTERNYGVPLCAGCAAARSKKSERDGQPEDPSPLSEEETAHEPDAAAGDGAELLQPGD